jgi:hypothetical protein
MVGLPSSCSHDICATSLSHFTPSPLLSLSLFLPLLSDDILSGMRNKKFDQQREDKRPQEEREEGGQHE